MTPLERMYAPESVTRKYMVPIAGGYLVSDSQAPYAEETWQAEGGGIRAVGPTEELAIDAWRKAKSRYFDQTAQKCQDCGEFGLRPLGNADQPWLVCSHCGVNVRC